MSNNKESAQILQNSNNFLSTFLHKKALLRALQDYEFERRKADRNFDVYEYIGEVLGHSSGTIRKFFNKFDRTGVKLGTDDILKMCIILQTDVPLLALMDDYNSLTNPNFQEQKLNKHKIASIKDDTLEAVKSIGNLAGDVSQFLSDSKLDLGEKESLKGRIDDAQKRLDLVKAQIEG